MQDTTRNYYIDVWVLSQKLPYNPTFPHGEPRSSYVLNLGLRLRPVMNRRACGCGVGDQSPCRIVVRGGRRQFIYHPAFVKPPDTIVTLTDTGPRTGLYLPVPPTFLQVPKSCTELNSVTLHLWPCGGYRVSVLETALSAPTT